jgi:hypothetical protein
MITTFDIDTELYKVLKDSTALTSALTGNIYTGERPVNSKKEDVTINTPSLSQDFDPQRGYSNVNIHVQDMVVKISGVEQKKEDRVRLKYLADIVRADLKAARIPGVGLTIMAQSTIAEPEVSQHFVNLRIEWSIHNN